MAITSQATTAPDNLSTLLYEAAKLGSRLEALAEKGSIEAIADEMQQQMHEKGRDWEPNAGTAKFICDWIDALHPHLATLYSVVDRYTQPVIRIRLDEFMRSGGLALVEFTVPQIFQYLDDEVAKRLGAQ